MKMLFASDSFKGSITSEKTIELLSKAANEVFGDCEVMGVPVADGGEGTVDAVIKAENGQLLSRKVKDPLWNEVDASYGVFRDCAIIEMATASGLPLVPTQYRNPMDTTTYGTGELILDAINKDYRNIYIAIGGSATNDGGMGCARALGIRFFDKDGHELEGIGRDLINVATIDTSCMDTRIKECTITVMCDVKNPLCGPNGATYTYGPQKGLSADDIDILEEGMCNYRDVIKEQFNVDCDSIEGAGAAGGLGAALCVFFNGSMKSGIDSVLDLIDFDSRLEGVDLVVTGEGRTDWQSCFGKVMQGVGIRAKQKSIPVIGLSGSLGENALDICKYGVSSLMTTVNAPMTLDYAMEHANELYYEAAVRMFSFVKVGIDMEK